MKNILILGAGQMGLGIAQVFATKGFKVELCDISEAQLEKAKSSIEKSLNKFASKGKISQELVASSMGNLNFIQDLSKAGAAQIAIEAVNENIDLKRKVFEMMDEKLPANTILCSNTSSISITEIASFTKRPEKVMGVHFMNPVPIMKLVELIKGLQTDEALFSQVKELMQAIDKTPVVSNDYPGFIVNRILMPMINEAVYAVYEGLATVEDIDAAMKLGTNVPMGPLTLADFIGLDTCLAIMEVLHNGLGDSKYRPCPLLRNYVTAGYLGRKSGRGFYRY